MEEDILNPEIELKYAVITILLPGLKPLSILFNRKKIGPACKPYMNFEFLMQ